MAAIDTDHKIHARISPHQDQERREHLCSRGCREHALLVAEPSH